MFKMVMVKWMDSGGNSRWIDLAQAEKDKVCEIETIGYLIVDNNEQITVGQSWDEGNKCVNAIITIPKFAVKSIESLRKSSRVKL